MTERWRPAHATRSRAFALRLPAREAFDLFTPEGEKAWAEGWEPEYLHPADGALREGTIFRTRAGGEETIWAVARTDRAASTIEYVRITPGSRAAIVTVRCANAPAGGCVVTVTYAITGLTDAGNDWVAAMDADRYAAYIHGWKASIDDALRRRARDPALPTP